MHLTRAQHGILQIISGLTTLAVLAVIGSTPLSYAAAACTALLGTLTYLKPDRVPGAAAHTAATLLFNGLNILVSGPS